MRNVLERTVLTSEDGGIEIEELKIEAQEGAEESAEPGITNDIPYKKQEYNDLNFSLKPYIASCEKRLLMQMIKEKKHRSKWLRF